MERRKRKKVILIFLIAILAIGLFIMVEPDFFKSNHKDELTVYGNVDVRQVDIGFRISGKVRELFFEEGDFVHQGCLLATLDPNPYNSQLSESKASLAAIQANLNNAEILLKRRRELIDVGGVSQEDLNNAESTYNQLKASLAQAEASVQVAEDTLSFSKVYSPSDGIILTRIREPGTVVQASDPVYTLSIISPVWIRAFVDEPNLGNIYYGMPADIYTDTENGKVYKGKIGFISPVAEFTPKTVESTQLRTDLVYRLRIYAENPDMYLKQGMPVTVKLHLQTEKKTSEQPVQNNERE